MAQVRSWSLLALTCVPPLILLALLQSGWSGISWQLDDLHVTLIGIAVSLAAAFGVLALRAHLAHGDARTLAIGAALLAFAALYVWHGVFTHDLPPFKFLVFGPAARVAFALSLLGVASQKVSPPQARVRNVAVTAAGAGVLTAVGYGAAGRVAAWATTATVPQVQTVRFLLEMTALLLCFAVLLRLARNPAPAVPRGALFAGVILTSQQSLFFLPASPWSITWWAAHALGASGIFVLAWATLVVLQESAYRTEVEGLRTVEMARTAFFNSAAHELKTPLTPIGIQLHLLNQNTAITDEKTRKSLATLTRNFARLNEIVDELLMAARAPLDTGDWLSRPSNLSAIISAEAQKLIEAHVGRDLKIKLDVDPDIKVAMSTEQTANVVALFLRNAVSACPPGGAIHLSAHREGRSARVRVLDEGKPLRAEELPQAFLPFADAVGETPSGAKSMALYIARRIAEENHGEVWAESGGDTGRAFGFALPLGD